MEWGARHISLLNGMLQVGLVEKVVRFEKGFESDKGAGQVGRCKLASQAERRARAKPSGSSGPGVLEE